MKNIGAPQANAATILARHILLNRNYPRALPQFPATTALSKVKAGAAGIIRDKLNSLPAILK